MRERQVFDNTIEFLNFLHTDNVRVEDIRPIEVNLPEDALESFGVKPSEVSPRKIL